VRRHDKHTQHTGRTLLLGKKDYSSFRASTQTKKRIKIKIQDNFTTLTKSMRKTDAVLSVLAFTVFACGLWRRVSISRILKGTVSVVQ